MPIGEKMKKEKNKYSLFIFFVIIVNVYNLVSYDEGKFSKFLNILLITSSIVYLCALIIERFKNK